MSDTTQSTAPQATPARRESKWLPIFAMLGAVTLWGGAFPAMKIAVHELGPWSLMWVRLGIAVLVFLPFLHKLRPARITRKDIPLLALMAIFEPCLYFLCETNALRLTTSTQAGVISASMPLMVALGSWLVLKERVSRTLWIGITISTVGVITLTVAGGAASEHAPHPILGNILEIGAMACATGAALCISSLARRSEAGWNPFTLTAIQTVFGFFFFLPGAPYALANYDSWSMSAIGSLIYLGIGASLGAFGLYNWALSRLAASQVSMFINLVPVAVIIFGWLILGETLTLLQVIATGVIMIGVLIGSRSHL